MAILRRGRKVPEGLEGDAGDEDGDEDEDIVGYNNTDESPRAAPHPWKRPYPEIKDQDCCLREPQAQFVEEDAIPARLHEISSLDCGGEFSKRVSAYLAHRRHR